ncbi:MAG TPA: cyclic nucleotide-binding domain-containing protein [Spirochaetia bacterium]|nr:cyclic nucleotide-binding domain-containing protein [Spirochaetaceae bacterium]HRW25254.1 cyclic nucleotide-binding domain-containing protein [Spirochaetia bacterium]
MSHESALSKVSLFANLEPKYIKGIAQISTERDFAPGDHLMKQGEDGIGLFIILSGKVKIEKVNANGQSVEIASNGPGDVMGELAVLDGAKRTATVTAVEPTKCLVLASWEFNSFMKSHPEVGTAILPIVVRRFRETNDALIGLSGVKA